ncbi:MAG: L,D-transpeptidase family protein [Anaerolineae bacterium]|nr:L,D-transpeptidase family protein [Anaerolineae bacterium]
MKTLSRRTFLQSVGLAGAAMGMQSLLREPSQAHAQEGVTHWDGSSQARILLNYMTAYAEPNWRSKATGGYRYNDVVAVPNVAVGPGLYPNNSTWLETEQGYIYSSWVQPVSTQYNPIIPIGEPGAWGTLTVPISYSKSAPSDDATNRERIYYNHTGRVTALENNFYQISEIYGNVYWIKADQVRIMMPEEFAPLSPDVPADAKRIEVSIRDQMVYAYEGDQIVHQVNVSTGLPNTPTPFGDFYVRDKRHGQRMAGNLSGGGYNLAGIPFICYITKRWVALHGTYWHNNYGRRMSNGCINLRPADALWFFRWTTPVANYHGFNTVADDAAGQPGTKIKVRW